MGHGDVVTSMIQFHHIVTKAVERWTNIETSDDPFVNLPRGGTHIISAIIVTIT